MTGASLRAKLSLVGPILLAVTACCAPGGRFDPPVVTDEFDRILVTKETRVGDVIGRIELVFPNSKRVTWSLAPPVPGADRRRYLKEGQLDATEIVEIDPITAELRLKARPGRFPAHYYAQVRAANEDGAMDQVLIVIALERTPDRAQALDIFTQRKTGSAIDFYATAGVDPGKLEYAAKVAEALLSKDRKGSGRITANLARKRPVMTLFRSFEERNTAIGFYMYDGSLGLNTQDLEDEEIIPDYLRRGGPDDLRRDATVEEITHLIHEGGVLEAYPEVQKRLEKATRAAIDRGLFRPWDGLPEDSFSNEYLAIGLDIIYGVFWDKSHKGRIRDDDGSPIQPYYRLTAGNNVPMTAANLQKHDSELFEIVSLLFPAREEFFREMGWDRQASRILYLPPEGGRKELFVMDEDGSGKARLLNLPFAVEWPRWSPDGLRIVFVSYEKDHQGLYVVDREGGGLRKLETGPGSPDTPCWSHDGEWLAYTLEEREGRHIEILGINGGGPTVLAGDGIRGGYQSWSPVQPRLAFESARDGNPEIYTIGVNGSGLKRLTDDPSLDEWPAFSRDGSMIVWAHGTEGDKDLWIMNSDGSGKRRVTHGIALGDSFASFSPDGSRIVFASSANGRPSTIYTISLDGSGLKKVAEGSSPDWSSGL